MADNKKPKQDYREALAAQAEKVAPKDKRKETLTYDVGGEIVTIVRGDMSDESWEKVKAQVAPKEQTLKSKSLDWPTLMSLGQNLDGVADSVVSKEDKKLVARMPEWDRAEFLRQRFRTKGYDVPPNSADDEKASLKKQPEAEPKPAAKPSGPTPDEWTPYPTEPTKPKSQGTQTEDDQMVGSADPGMSPRGQMMRMAMGATPAQERLAEQEANVARVKAQGEKHGEEDLSTLKKGVQYLNENIPLNPGWIDQRVLGDKPIIPEEISSTVSDVAKVIPGTSAQWTGGIMKGVGGALGMKNLADKGQQVYDNGTASIDEAAGFTQGQQGQQAPSQPQPVPVTPQGQPQPVPPQEDPQMAAMRLAMQAPGGFKPTTGEEMDPAAFKAYQESRAKTKADIENAQDTMAALSIARDGAVSQYVKRELEVNKQASELAALQSQAKLNSINVAREYMGRRDAALEEARRAASDPTDPNRFWNSKDAGQKAMGVLAGALFGFTGQGMQWLQRIDGLVEQDIKMQMADRASKVRSLEAQAQGFGESMKDSLALGSQESDAFNIKRQQLYDGLKSFSDMTAQRTQNMDVKVKAMEISAGLTAKLASLDQEAMQSADARANNMNTAMFHNAQLAQSKYEMGIKALKGDGKDGATVKGPQAMELGGLAAAEAVARDLKTKFGEKNIISRMLDKGAALFPGTNAKNYNIARDQAINMIAPLMGAGVLQKHDLDRWEGLMAKAGDMNGEEILSILVTDIQRTYNEKRAALGAAGMDVSKFPQMGGASAGGVNYTPRK